MADFLTRRGVYPTSFMLPVNHLHPAFRGIPERGEVLRLAGAAAGVRYLNSFVLRGAHDDLAPRAFNPAIEFFHRRLLSHTRYHSKCSAKINRYLQRRNEVAQKVLTKSVNILQKLSLQF